MSALSLDQHATDHPRQGLARLIDAWPRLALALIVVLAAALRLANLGELGYVNHYYSAGITSMLQSWHNFFFVAAEPGAAVSIDKPPVGLWLQAASAAIFGINAFGVLLPQILAGLGSIIVLNHLVRRKFGVVAGLLAALSLAVTPVVIATDRNNTIDSLLIFCLLLATWVFIKASETTKWRFLILGAVLIGIGFNIKMLQAILPLPAIYLFYIVSTKQPWWRTLLQLVVASVVLAMVSLSWAVAVDLTPADQRPYVGSSGDNSVLSLMLGYNGLQRLQGMNAGSGGASGMRQRGNVPLPQRGNGNFTPPNNQTGANPQPAQPNPGNGNSTPPNQTSPNAGRGGGSSAIAGGSEEGFDRLLSTPLSKEVSWLLPFGLASVLLLLARGGLGWPVGAKHGAAALWGGWLLTAIIFFSIAGFYHEYYLAMLAAPLAALVGIGAVEFWHWWQANRWAASICLILAVLASLGLQQTTALAFVEYNWWLGLSVIIVILGVGVLLWASIRQIPRLAQLAFSSLLIGLLITPSIWSGYTTMNASANQSLPSAYSGIVSGPPNNGGLTVNQALIDYLQANTHDVEYLMAVPSSMQGSDYVLATGRPVLYMGGFMGIDTVLTKEQLVTMVANNQLRYIYWNRNGGNGFGAGSNSQSDISNWINNSCTIVNGFDTTTQNSGAPGGTSTSATQTTQNRGGFGAMQISLYDCGNA